MAYATVPAFVAFVGEMEARTLAPTTPPGAGHDVAKIQDALDNQSAVLDTYFATRMAVPLTPVPRVVVVNCLVLAREELDRTGRDTVVKAADRVRAWARDVSKGVATLGVDTSSPEAPAPNTTDGVVAIDAPDRVFDDAGLAPFLRGF